MQSAIPSTMLSPAPFVLGGITPSLGSAGALRLGITRTEFLQNYFEQRWFLRRSAVRESKFAWRDVDELLTRIEPISPRVALFHQGEVAPEHYTDRHIERGSAKLRLNKALFYDYMSRGATFVMNKLDESSSAARRLCNEVSRFTGHPSIGNAYLSFGGSGTFGKHWDTHDVFVVQLLGRKRWQVFEPTMPLPLSHQVSGGYQSPKQPVLDIELRAGDILYLPRGWWHQAIPRDTGSFHLSIGTYPPTALDYLQWLHRHSLSALPSARSGISGMGTQTLDVDTVLSSLARELRDPESLAAYRRSRWNDEVAAGEFNFGLLLDSQRGELPEGTRVALCNCYLQSDTVDAALAGNALSTPLGGQVEMDGLRKSLVRSLASVTTTDLHRVYAAFESVPRPVVCTALLDLARHDIVAMWYE